jgi:TonB family protein
MNDSKAWSQYEGQVIDQKYRLERFLGSTDHSAVFLTEVAQPKPRKAAIKFIPADFPGAEKQGDVWAAAAALNHPNLLRLYAEGYCKLEGMELLYVVMEYAEENLGQFLPLRAMSGEEMRPVLSVATDVLVYLHGKKLTHGHLKPSNVLAKGDLLKFSSDTIRPAGEALGLARERDAYDAPETAVSPASDVWSLGVTLVEALTQQAPVLPPDGRSEPPIPATLGEPFLEIARHTLRREAKWRWTIAQVAARLSPAAAAPKAVAASAGAATKASAAASVVPATPPPPVVGKISPVDVPLSKERAVPLAKQVVNERATPRVDKRREEALAAVNRTTLTLPSYVVPVFAVVLALVAIIVLPKILRRHMETSLASIERSSQQSGAAKPAAEVAAGVPKPGDKPTQVEAPTAAKPVARDTVTVTAEPSGEAGVAPVGAPAAAAPRTRSDGGEATRTTKTTSSSSARGEVLEQVLPKIPEKALATISGTVRVGVKAQVDAAGNVSDVGLETPGPSRYFAEQALSAARHWVFNTPAVDGRSVPSEWLIRFEFRQSGVQASSSQSAP